MYTNRNRAVSFVDSVCKSLLKDSKWGYMSSSFYVCYKFIESSLMCIIFFGVRYRTEDS